MESKPLQTTSCPAVEGELRGSWPNRTGSDAADDRPPTDRPTRPPLRRNYTATVIFPGRPSEALYVGRARDLSRPWGFLSSYKLAQQVVSRTRHRGEGERDEGEPGSRATGSNLHEEKGTKETRRCRRSLRRDKRSEGDKNVERRKGRERERERGRNVRPACCAAPSFLINIVRATLAAGVVR